MVQRAAIPEFRAYSTRVDARRMLAVMPHRSKRPATRADVARLAGVSESTVSYALSGVRSIAEDTRIRVLAAAEELGYTPNVMAQGLAGKKSGMIALMFPVSNRGFEQSDWDYVGSVSRVVEAAGYQLLMWPNPIEDLDALQRIAKQRLVDGIVLMEVRSNDPRPAILRAERIPYVLIGRTDDTSESCWVDADFSTWGPMAIERLADRGHRSVMFLSPPESVVESRYAPLMRTERALLDSAQHLGVTVHVRRADWTIKAGRDVMLSTANEHPEVTAVVGFNELAMIGALEAIASLGKRVPDDYSILQFGIDAASAEATTPAQNTVGVDGVALGAKAAEFLLQRLNGETEPLHDLRPPVYVDRGSISTARSV